jgi:toxin FitB
MIVLDTNVLSALMRTDPDAVVTAWLDRQPRTSVWITSLTVLEIRYGLQLLSDGKRRSILVSGFESLLEGKIGARIASFDTAAAGAAGDLMAARQKAGRPSDLRDTMIAGIVIARHAVLATRNTQHFDDAGMNVVNPWN